MNGWVLASLAWALLALLAGVVIGRVVRFADAREEPDGDDGEDPGRPARAAGRRPRRGPPAVHGPVDRGRPG
ncbi:hypothetical protein SAMN05660690_2894 [Geodermatophilus telluris]|uniref:Uncharacterized protein n=1 Tax=Geodermatophilus telluris TaxID=1190417 RepID=A0A1G6QFQ5_9ACTN|nr:hypothetical protein [Geodermatophilus telluris]SDC91310.1 hypothetical protein SAMN05660690_2894 [Geodermatophilus telluris]